jgi:predicted permease
MARLGSTFRQAWGSKRACTSIINRARTLDGIAIFAIGSATLSGRGEPEQIRITRATPTLAQVLRVPPSLGRWFTSEESEPGSPQVAVLSNGLWLRRYGGDSGLIGKTVTLNGTPVQVIGIMPPDYAFPDPGIDMWLPASVTRASGLGLWVYRGVARLREGVTLEQARAELNTLLRDVPQAFPNDPLARATGPEFGVMSTARILKETIIGGVAGALWILLAAVGIVLLVACLNVANLFLVRAEARRREMTVRHALGAGSGAIARLLFAESALLSLSGGLLGLALAWSAVRLLVSASPATLPRLEEVRLDGVVAAFTFLLSVLAACSFGSMPLWRGVSFTAFHDRGRRMTATRSQHYVRHVLMGGQVALALVLLVSSGLMVKSFQKLRAIDPGFNPASTFTFGVGLPPGDYPTKEAALAAHRRILDGIATVPGVAHVSSTTCLPFDGPCFSNGVMVEGREGPVPETNLGDTSYRAVEGGYFQTMGIPLIRGRAIERDDVERSEPVAVVNQRFVDLVFPNDDPIGKRVSWTLPAAKEGESPKYTWLTIVGIVRNTPTRTLREASVVPHLYMPLSMTGGFDAPTWEYIGPRFGTLNYVVRASAISEGLLSNASGRQCSRFEFGSRAGKHARRKACPDFCRLDLQHGSADDRGCSGSSSGSCRDLWRGVVYRESEDKRDRCAPCVRGGSTQRHGYDRRTERARDTGRDRSRSRGNARHRTSYGIAAVRRQPARSGRPCRNDFSACDRRHCGLLLPARRAARVSPIQALHAN